MSASRQPARWVLLLCVSAFLAGCGSGASRPAGKAPNDTTRARIQQHLGLGMASLSLSGAQSGRMAEALNGLGGGPWNFGMLGVFMRSASLAMVGSRSESDPGEGGDGETKPDPGWDGEPGFYYDEWLGLWVFVHGSDTSSKFELFEDQEQTKPAGTIISTWPADPTLYPQRHTYDYNIEAGFMAGSHGTTEILFQSETKGRMTYEHTWAGGWTSEGTAEWDGKQYTWTNRSKEADGFWSRDSGTFSEDGSGTVESENSWGYRSRFTYNADGSGKGVIEGPDDGLPAVITWDSEGNVRIVWPDGTVEEYNWYGWVETASGSSLGQTRGRGTK